jgi:hypothetical protein
VQHPEDLGEHSAAATPRTRVQFALPPPLKPPSNPNPPLPARHRQHARTTAYGDPITPASPPARPSTAGPGSSGPADSCGTYVGHRVWCTRRPPDEGGTNPGTTPRHRETTMRPAVPYYLMQT